MTLRIKNREVEELARAKVVAMARPHDEDIVERVMEIARRCAARPDIGTMTDDEILGHDEVGAPIR